MDLTVIEQEVATLPSTPIVIINETHLTVASSNFALLRKKIKAVQKFFLDDRRPFNDALAVNLAKEKEILAPLKEREAAYGEAITTYRRKTQAEALLKQVEELERFKRESESGVALPPALVATSAKTTVTFDGTVTARSERKWRIEDETLIPREYLMPNTAKISSHVRAGGEIPGVATWTQECLSVR